MKLLIDTDILIYTSAAFHEEAKEVEPGYWTWFVDEKKVKRTMKEKLDWYMNHLKGTELHLCLSDVSNFRRDLAGTYKGKRSNLRRPILLKKLRQDLIDEGAIVYPNLEADDVMGILATTWDDTIIVSIDKDLKTIPGKYFKDTELGIQDISVEQADYYHLYQTLIGDAIDGYGGIKGVGPVAAHKILKEPSWEAVMKAFDKAGYTEDYALQQARMARILRASDWDDNLKQPILWRPPNN